MIELRALNGALIDFLREDLIDAEPCDTGSIVTYWARSESGGEPWEAIAHVWERSERIREMCGEKGKP